MQPSRHRDVVRIDPPAVFRQKVPGPTPDEYTFANNAIVTLVGPEGGIVTRFSSDTAVDDLARALRRLIDPAGS